MYKDTSQRNIFSILGCSCFVLRVSIMSFDTIGYKLRLSALFWTCLTKIEAMMVFDIEISVSIMIGASIFNSAQTSENPTDETQSSTDLIVADIASNHGIDKTMMYKQIGVVSA